jgi:RNA polymerase sigma factor for flagellar operon FliA
VSGADPTDGGIPGLWREFKERRSMQARAKLILRYAPLATHVAEQVGERHPAMVDQFDVAAFGMFGLIDVLERFDSNGPASFEQYAIPHIRSAVEEELRALS